MWTRILVGIPTVVVVAVVAWLDMYLSDTVVSPVPRGVVLLPLYLVCQWLLCDELLDLLHAAGVHPRRRAVFLSVAMMMLVSWLACIWQQWKLSQGIAISPRGWDWAATSSVATLLAVAGGLLIAFVAEMQRFRVQKNGPLHTSIHLSGAVFVIVYIGLLSTFLVQLRVAHGIAALLSLVAVVKAADSGAYFVGKLFGRHKINPGISPGKTMEGFCGGVAAAVLASAIWFELIMPLTRAKTSLFENLQPTPMWGWLLFGILIALAGYCGDLAESMLKRDVARKDSSRWLPGLGGMLDIFDSILMAAPVAYALWTFGLVCPHK
ncbi:MAG: phosphatidate cytidylyltransferase [Thermoguttaceae bacterium]